MRPNKYQPGDKLGPLHMELIQRTNSGNRRRQFALFECSCGAQFTADIQKIRTGRTKSCGCGNRAKTQAIPRSKLLTMINTWYAGLNSNTQEAA